ncbi:MAG: serine/threonine-protein kinase, partial [Myxococcota bacterium]
MNDPSLPYRPTELDAGVREEPRRGRRGPTEKHARPPRGPAVLASRIIAVGAPDPTPVPTVAHAPADMVVPDPRGSAPTVAQPPELTESPALPAARPALGSGGVFADRYRLVRPIGQGASATVWVATDLELDRDVALKIFVEEGAGRDAMAKVAQEARESSRIVSDFAIRIHNAAFDEARGMVAIDMELSQEFDEHGEARLGRPLFDRVEGQPVDSREEVRRRVRWVMEVARGVEAAHRQNVFHRDLKGDNVLVRPVSERAQVLDFGLAALGIASRDGAAGAKRRTIVASEKRGQTPYIIAGTLAYMAPEQARGLPRLDPHRDDDDRATLQRIDVFGLGAVLFEALTGEPPHRDQGENNVAFLRKIVEQPVDFAQVPGRRLVPRSLRRVLDRALAHDPSWRHASADALADDLEAFLDGRPTSLDRGDRRLRARLWARRHKYALSAAVS